MNDNNNLNMNGIRNVIHSIQDVNIMANNNNQHNIDFMNLSIQTDSSFNENYDNNNNNTRIIIITII